MRQPSGTLWRCWRRHSMPSLPSGYAVVARDETIAAFVHVFRRERILRFFGCIAHFCSLARRRDCRALVSMQSREEEETRLLAVLRTSPSPDKWSAANTTRVLTHQLTRSLSFSLYGDARTY